MARYAADDFDAIRKGMIEKGLMDDPAEKLREQQKKATAIDRDLPAKPPEMGDINPSEHMADAMEYARQAWQVQAESRLFRGQKIAPEIVQVDTALTPEKLRDLKRKMAFSGFQGGKTDAMLRRAAETPHARMVALTKRPPLSGKPGDDCPIAPQAPRAYGLTSLRGESLFTLRKLWRRANRDGDEKFQDEIEAEAEFRGVLDRGN